MGLAIVGFGRMWSLSVFELEGGVVCQLAVMEGVQSGSMMQGTGLIEGMCVVVLVTKLVGMA